MIRDAVELLILILSGLNDPISNSDAGSWACGIAGDADGGTSNLSM